jgi:signal transduction histidine kinase
MGHLELLEPDLTGAVAREDHGVVLRQLERMSSLSSRLLALARLETGGGVHQVDVIAADLVLDVSRNWESSAQRVWITDLRYGGHLRADPSWLELALDALVENALKFTQTGDTIRLSCRSAGGTVYLDVADSGPGVPDDVGAVVFDRFWHRPPPDGRPGTGLGLSLVRAIAEAHGGQARVSRAPEGGAQFTLALPVTAASQRIGHVPQVTTT